MRNHHYNAAAEAFEYADELEQLSRPMGRSAGICLLKAAVASDVGNPAHAVNNLNRASTRLKSDGAKVGGLQWAAEDQRPRTNVAQR